MLSNKQIMRNRIFFGMGTVGITVFDTFIGSFLILYATDILGFDALYFASFLVLPRILEVLIDFFVMYFVGKTRSRLGMYRPWLLSMIGIAGALVTMFSVPFLNVGEAAAITIIVIAYFISNTVCTSIYWIVYVAMPGGMTEDGNELVRLSSSRSIFDYASSILASAITMPILLAFGYNNPQGWLVAAGIFAAISLICSLLCFIFVKTDLNLEKKNTREYNAKEMLSDFKTVICDKGFLAVAFMLFFINIAVFNNTTVAYYFYIHNLHIEHILAYLMIIAAMAAILAALFASKIKQKLGFKKSIILAAALLLTSGILMTQTYSAAMMTVTGCIQVAGSTLAFTYLYSLWPKVAQSLDSASMKTPLNSTITIANLFNGIGTLLGSTLGAAIITFSKYDADLATQTQFTLDAFRYCSPAVTIILSSIVIAIAVFAFKKEEDKQWD